MSETLNVVGGRVSRYEIEHTRLVMGKQSVNKPNFTCIFKMLGEIAKLISITF